MYVSRSTLWHPGRARGPLQCTSGDHHQERLESPPGGSSIVLRRRPSGIAESSPASLAGDSWGLRGLARFGGGELAGGEELGEPGSRVKVVNK